MKTEEYIVNLDLPAEERWLFLGDLRNEIDELLECYLNDFEGAHLIFDGIGLYKEQVISKEYLLEIDSIASISKFNADEVLIANLYYDILKFYFGCTAFAHSTGNTIFHSRNLDWHTENNLLSRHSRIFNFTKDGNQIFRTVGWPGFIGTLSGIKPNKFSITLNAVLSNDSPEIATPISFLIRDVLATANTFVEAKSLLEKTTIASDCLILLSGIQDEELAVIERTPKRFATRKPKNDSVVVTNDYKLLENFKNENSILQLTSCGRFDRAKSILNNSVPKSFDECFAILKDDEVKMGITVQQMVFNNKTGEIQLIKTGGNKRSG